ncbi:MAG: hypothetical protein E7293_05155 [Lachnospiraceae bacterium]|nr:hypothetical protein [Lachnospiraceae bacterium]
MKKYRRCLEISFCIEEGLQPMEKRIEQIRESERQSYIEMYSSEELYKTHSWMKKPIKTIQELIPLFEKNQELKV